eukprot:2406422-Amphidinium_carterae.1
MAPRVWEGGPGWEIKSTKGDPGGSLGSNRGTEQKSAAKMATNRQGCRSWHANGSYLPGVTGNTSKACGTTSETDVEAH